MAQSRALIRPVDRKVRAEGRRSKGVLCAAVAAVSLFAFASIAHAATPITLSVDGLKGKGGRAQVLQRITVKGQLDPPDVGVPVSVTVDVGTFKPTTTQLTSDASGAFSLPITVTACCTYKITATANGNTTDTSFGVQIPHDLHQGSRGPVVQLFNKLLRDQGYFVHSNKRFDSGTDLAVLAFRKVNRMSRTEKFNAKIFKMLLQGRGAFGLRHKDPQRHVEADLSRQVLVLVENGKPKYTFPISSGKPSTPTVTGTFHFYLQTPGTNAKGMYYSSYFIAGYATHGYPSVPNYPASHGCLRNPMSDARFIYSWINIGDTIYVYH